jgi:propanol-preferring alcohol dehydrogenase
LRFRPALLRFAGAGRVVALGKGVDAGQWKVGDRAGIKPCHSVCHACGPCRNGATTICDNGKFSGLMTNGSYCQYLLSPANYTPKIPEGIEDAVAATVMCR